MAAPYRQLCKDRQEIRLIAGITIENGQLSCQLKHVFLDEDPRYNAISWCWGEQSHKTNILLNGKQTTVRGNAERVLRWLHMTNRLPAWLDAVCINQLDLDERSHQVTMMREIYSTAGSTLVVLDLDATDRLSESALHSIKLIVQQAHEQTNNLYDFDTQIHSTSGGQKYSTEPLPEVDWEAVCAFFAVPWFTRIWIVQEILLSKIAMLFFGQVIFDWNDVRVAASWLQHRSYWTYLTRNAGTIGIDNCSLMANKLGLPAQKDTWWQLMTLSRMFKSTDARDKVYALLGLRHMHSTSVPIVPDYSKNVADIYIETTKGLIREHDSLHIILPANSLDPLPGAHVGQFPSWVPRYDYWMVREGQSYRPISMDIHRGAANLIKAQVHASEENILAVDGVIVDKVMDTSPILSERLINNLEHFIQVMYHIWNLACHANQSRPQDLRRTMMDVMSSGSLSVQENLNKADLLNKFAGFLGALQLDGAEANIDDFSAFKKSIWLWSVNRVFFTTESGYIGMGPRDTLVGDELVILFGSRIPCMLRECIDSKHLYVGDTFAAGIMKGDFVIDLQARGLLQSTTVRFDIK